MDDFFRFSKKLGFWVFLVHPTVVSVLLSALVERYFVSRMQNFLSGRLKIRASTLSHRLIKAESANLQLNYSSWPSALLRTATPSVEYLCSAHSRWACVWSHQLEKKA